MPPKPDARTTPRTAVRGAIASVVATAALASAAPAAAAATIEVDGGPGYCFANRLNEGLLFSIPFRVTGLAPGQSVMATIPNNGIIPFAGKSAPSAAGDDGVAASSAGGQNLRGSRPMRGQDVELVVADEATGIELGRVPIALTSYAFEINRGKPAKTRKTPVPWTMSGLGAGRATTEPRDPLYAYYFRTKEFEAYESNQKKKPKPVRLFKLGAPDKCGYLEVTRPVLPFKSMEPLTVVITWRGQQHDGRQFIFPADPKRLKERSYAE